MKHNIKSIIPSIFLTLFSTNVFAFYENTEFEFEYLTKATCYKANSAKNKLSKCIENAFKENNTKELRAEFVGNYHDETMSSATNLLSIIYSFIDDEISAEDSIAAFKSQYAETAPFDSVSLLTITTTLNTLFKTENSEIVNLIKTHEETIGESEFEGSSLNTENIENFKTTFQEKASEEENGEELDDLYKSELFYEKIFLANEFLLQELLKLDKNKVLDLYKENPETKFVILRNIVDTRNLIHSPEQRDKTNLYLELILDDEYDFDTMFESLKDLHNKNAITFDNFKSGKLDGFFNKYFQGYDKDNTYYYMIDILSNMNKYNPDDLKKMVNEPVKFIKTPIN